MPLAFRFQEYIGQYHLFNKGQTVLLAVSGGLDSAVMCDLFFKSGYSFAIAHCNFQLRGDESLRDEKFVRNLSEKYHVAFHLTHFETAQIAEQRKISIQVAARELRYEWLGKIRVENNYVFIATAHQLNDNAETALMNFTKGTGIAGLHGILPKQGKIIRPLLFAGRKEIEEYAQQNNIDFVEDSSNLSDKYTRNFFRHHVIPAMQQQYPNAVKNIAQTIEHLNEAEILYEQQIEIHRKKIIEKRGEEYFIPVLKLAKCIPLKTIVHELFRPFGFTPAQVSEIIKLLQSESGKMISSSTHRVVLNRKWLIITSLYAVQRTHYVLEENDTNITADNIQLHIKKIEKEKLASIPSSAAVACLDAAKLAYPLILRKCKTGDYFYPLGMKKKKKLSRFFIDQKLSLPEKEKTWVLESAKKIVWIIGLRIDDRFKITAHTKEVKMITLSEIKAH